MAETSAPVSKWKLSKKVFVPEATEPVPVGGTRLIVNEPPAIGSAGVEAVIDRIARG